KLNDRTMYVHSKSNHPPSNLKAIPVCVNNRLSNLSSNPEIFNQESHYYQNALDKSGYNFKLNFTLNEPKKRRKRKRKILWFNPPFSNNVRTNIGQKFFKILDHCFPPSHPLYKLFNRSNVKLSYCTVKNMRQVINSHNKKILTPLNQLDEEEKCNCQKNKVCPMGRISGGCNAKNI
ncbi:Hypothetical protein FKW44_015206, partial [Caligus rogercresseyi]